MKPGLVPEERYHRFLEKKAKIETEIERLSKTVIKPTEKVNTFLEKQGSSLISVGVKLAELLKRTELTYQSLAEIDENRPNLSNVEAEEVQIQIKYDGYIKMQKIQVENFKKLERKKLPEDLDYDQVKGICLEARQKLNKQKPTSIGQASRISGVSPADISVLLIYMEQYYRNQKEESSNQEGKKE